MKRVIEKCHPTRRRGVVIVFTAVTLLVLLGMAALAVDVGYICALTTETQNNADAGSLAGASVLRPGEGDSVREQVLDILARNQAAQGFQSLEDQTIEIGEWGCNDSGFVPLDLSDVDQANAVRVVARRNDVPLFFAAILGHHSTNVSREAVAIFRQPCSGIWGLDSATIPGNVYVDSYDSTEGPCSLGSAGSEGGICSNQDITIAGSVEVYGDVMPGPEGSLVVNGGSAIVTGNTCSHPGSGDLPPVELGEVEINNDNGSIGLTDDGNNPFVSGANVYIGSHDNLTLAPGTYYFESLEFGSWGSLTVTGPTTIYLAGDYNASGQGSVNATQNPADLTIISSGASFTMSGSTEFYGSLYAPNAAVTLSGTADYYGSLVAKTVKISGNFQVHVDESLALTSLVEPPPPMLVK